MDLVHWVAMLAQAIGGQWQIEGDRSNDAKPVYVLAYDRLMIAH